MVTFKRKHTQEFKRGNGSLKNVRASGEQTSVFDWSEGKICLNGTILTVLFPDETKPLAS